MIYVYILILFIAVIFSFKINNGDYFNLSFLLIVGYFLSAICCVYNIDEWAVDLHILTLVILLIGIFSFIIGSYFGRHIKKHIHYNKKTVSIYDVASRGEGYIKLLLVVAFDLIILFFLYRDIVRIASLNYVSWGNLFYNYRSNLGNEELGANYSMIVDIGLRITKPLAYVYLFIFLTTLFNKSKKVKGIFPKLKKCLYCIPSLLYAVQVIIQGYRIQFIELIVAGLFYLFYLFQQNHNWRGKLNYKIIRNFGIFFGAILVGFYYIKFFIGKLQESNGVLSYVTNYLGGSLQLFDMYLENPINKGHETFAAFINSFQKFDFFKGVDTVVQHEYRSASTGVYIGNVYTGFRNYYNDYWLFGVILCSFALGFIFSYWYYYLRKVNHWTIGRIYSFLLYGYFLYSIVFHFFTDYFFALIGIGWMVNLLIFYGIVFLLFGVKFKKIKFRWKNG